MAHAVSSVAGVYSGLCGVFVYSSVLFFFLSHSEKELLPLIVLKGEFIQSVRLGQGQMPTSGPHLIS